MLSMGCLSTRKNEVSYVVPSIEFPEFPLADDMTRNPDGTVSVPSEWLVELEKYHIRIESTEILYNEIKKIYEEREK